MNKKGKFILGAAIGAALGVLFAPAKGSETRKVLKTKLEELTRKVKEIDLEEVKVLFDDKIEEIRLELEDLDQEKVVKMAKKKASQIKTKLNELVELAKEKGTPILQDAAKEVLENVVKASEDTIKKLEEKEMKSKKD